jgi:hypothetical protein
MNRFFEKGIEISEDVYLRTGDIHQAIAVLDRTCSMCKVTMPCHMCPIDLKRDEYEHPRKVAVREYAVASDSKYRLTYKTEEAVHINRKRPKKNPVIVRHPTMPGFIKFTRR